MVARNFTLQDLPYTRLLQVSDEDREFLTLEELKPHQLTELSGVTLASENGPKNNTNILTTQPSPSGSGPIPAEHQLPNSVLREEVPGNKGFKESALIIACNFLDNSVCG